MARPIAALTVGGSMRAGIAFVHQELNLFDNLDVAANVYIGREPRKGGFLQLVDTEKLRATVQPYLDRLGATFSPATPVARLSLAQQQMVEIAKALSFNSRLVILDEPTSSLPDRRNREAARGHRRPQGRTASRSIFISHRLNEIVEACDRVLVLRDGHLVGTLEGEAITHDAMVKLMVGRDLKVAYTPPDGGAGRGGPRRRKRCGPRPIPFQEVDLDLYRGEILGLAGLVGAGRTELARAFFGIDPLVGGTVILEGKPIRFAASADAVKAGIFLVPEDRKGDGHPARSADHREHLAAQSVRLSARRHRFARGRAGAGREEPARRSISVRRASPPAPAALSGGNQQKVVLAKWLAMDPKVIIFDEPTRGIDVGAKSEIYRLMRELADAASAVLMISSDMEEVIGVSDRVAVMHEGRISGILDRDAVQRGEHPAAGGGQAAVTA